MRVYAQGSARRSPAAGNRGQGGKWLHPPTRRRIYERDEWKCVWCEHEVATIVVSSVGPRRASVDHVVPRSRGGSNAPGNLITACSDCNAKRGRRSVPAFARTLCDTVDGAQRVVRRVRAACRRRLP